MCAKSKYVERTWSLFFSFWRQFFFRKIIIFCVKLFLYFCRIAREGSVLEYFWVRFVRYWSILYVRQTSIFVIWVSYVKGKKKSLGRKEVLNFFFFHYIRNLAKTPNNTNSNNSKCSSNTYRKVISTRY